MTTDHRTQARVATRDDRDAAGLPVLLLAALAAMLGTVAAIWAFTATSAVWTMVVAIVIAMFGAVGLIAVVGGQLADSDGGG